MKFDRTYFFIGSVILLIILLTASFSPNFVPYYPNEIFTIQYPYEAFSTLNYSSNSDNIIIDNETSYLIDGDCRDCKKVYGFDGLFCKPYVADKKVDPFIDTPGNPTSFGRSSGLSNSMGSLSLSADQIKLLQTRGGNQSCVPAEIGSK
jgi:hypothetical protein